MVNLNLFCIEHQNSVRMSYDLNCKQTNNFIFIPNFICFLNILVLQVIYSDNYCRLEIKQMHKAK